MRKNKLLVLFSYSSVYANFTSMSYHYNYLCGMLFLQMKQEQSHHCMYRRLGTLFSQILRERKDKSPIVVAMRSRRQTHSEGQCRQWSAVYQNGGPKAESPLSQGPHQHLWKSFIPHVYMSKPTTPIP